MACVTEQTHETDVVGLVFNPNLYGVFINWGGGQKAPPPRSNSGI